MRSPPGSAPTPNGEPGNGTAGDDDKQKDESTLLFRISVFMGLWYFMSGCTLFGNKHILSTLGCDPNVLAMSQMVSTASFGAFKMYGPQLLGLGKPQPTPLSSQPFRNFILDMAVVGLMRFATVMLGLVSLKFVAVSLTETVKSSAPFFTVIFAARCHAWGAYVAHGEPVAHPGGGRALAPAPRRSFLQLYRLFAAVFNNVIDCVQNVFSKKLLNSHYNYVNLQFYTSVAALIIQLPLMLYNHLGSWIRRSTPSLGARDLPPCQRPRLPPSVGDGLCCHGPHLARHAIGGQHAKRALLIWLSIIYFGNPVTPLSAVGTIICIGGVFAYNHARRKWPYAPPPLLPLSTASTGGRDK